MDGPATSRLELGYGLTPQFWRLPTIQRADVLREVEQEGFDHLVVSDHVAFRGGGGRDGLIQAAMLATISNLPIHIGVLLLPLRHPTVVARQAIDIVEQAGTSLVIGVGVGGEDPVEYSMCGATVETRGSVLDEQLPLLRRLLDGEPVNHDGHYVTATGGGLRRTTNERIEITVGGASQAALRRAADHDGWLGAFCDPPTWTHRASTVRSAANGARSLGLQIWAGIDDDPAQAAAAVNSELEQFYGVPGKAFAANTPAGPPEAIVDYAQPFLDAGLTRLNVFPVSVDPTACARLAAPLRHAL